MPMIMPMQIISHTPNESAHASKIVAGSKPIEAKRVLLADDDPLVRTAVGLLFSRHKEFEVAGEAKNGQEAIAMATALKPDLLMLDVNMPIKAGLESLADLSAAVPNMRIIMLTVAIEKRQILEALQSGARGIVLKEAARTLLIDAANAVSSGQYWIDRHPISNVARVIAELQPAVAAAAATSDGLLTPKETQIVRFIVEGATNKDIARNLRTSEQVVKNHMGRIFDKLGVFNRLELALYALDHHIAKRH
jgi:two-component system nitrate/nitrite response regulator NarL